MARPLRRDGPDTFHHISNRAIAKRSYFEDAQDLHYFLDRLIAEHEAGRVTIVNYCLLTTHFHLLLHSPTGEISEAMRRIQSQYTLHFNWRRDRDGGLQKGRFWSSLIDSDAYFCTTMRYIDDNAKSAGIVRVPEDYPWAAIRYRLRDAAPTWLDQVQIERFMRDQVPTFVEPRASYLRLFGGKPSASEVDWVERRLRAPTGGSGLARLDDLLSCASDRFRAMLIEATTLADGCTLGAPGASPIAVERQIALRRQRLGSWKVGPVRRRRCVWRLMAAGLLRDLCGLPWKEIEQRLGEGASMLKRLVEEHRSMLREGGEYSVAACEIGQAALRESCGVRELGGGELAEIGRTRRRNRALEALAMGGGQPVGGFRSDPN